MAALDIIILVCSPSLILSTLQALTHGAKNSTSAGLPDLSTIESKLDGFKSTTAEAETPATASAAAKICVIRSMVDDVVVSSRNVEKTMR